MSFGQGILEGLGSAFDNNKNQNQNQKNKKQNNSSQQSPTGVGSIDWSGKSARSRASSADTAKEYPGSGDFGEIDSGGY